MIVEKYENAEEPFKAKNIPFKEDLNGTSAFTDF
jgi:hypothetical protein